MAGRFENNACTPNPDAAVPMYLNRMADIGSTIENERKRLNSKKRKHAKGLYCDMLLIVTIIRVKSLSLS
jgi:hypothetical protein